MLAVNIQLIDQLLCSLVGVLSLGLNFKRSWHVIMNIINIWQPQEKTIKKQWLKLLWWIFCVSLWIFAQSMNARMRFLFKKLQHFPFHSCILEAKFCWTILIGLVIFNFLPDQHRFGLDRQSCTLWDCHQNADQFICCCLSVLIIHLNDLFIPLIITKTHQLSNSVFSIEP